MRHYSVDLGVAIPTSTVRVQDRATEADLAEMVGRYEPRPTLGISSPSRYLWAGLNYRFKFGYSWQSLNRQRDPGSDSDGVNLGTAADNYALFVTPVLAYSIGTRRFEEGKGKHLSLGVGLGAGWLLADGDVVLTELPGQPRHAFSFNSPSVAAALLIEARWNRWSLLAKLDGPRVDSGDLHYGFLKNSVSLNYNFTPDDFMAPPTDSKEQLRPTGGWATDLVVSIGGRSLPVASAEGVSGSAGGGVATTLMLASKPRHWPLQLLVEFSHVRMIPFEVETDFFDSNSSTKTARLEGSSFVIDTGFRNHWRETKTWQPFFAGGVSLGWDSIGGSLDGEPVSDRDFTFGYWLGLGMQWNFRDHWIVSLEGRMLDLGSELMGVQHRVTGGRILLGTGWRF